MLRFIPPKYRHTSRMITWTIIFALSIIAAFTLFVGTVVVLISLFIHLFGPMAVPFAVIGLIGGFMLIFGSYALAKNMVENIEKKEERTFTFLGKEF